VINPIESICYSIARGVVRAYLDVLREADTAVEEIASDADRQRTANFRDAVQQQLRRDKDSSDPKPDHSASDSRAGDSGNLGGK
jgi:hypothetical protein